MPAKNKTNASPFSVSRRHGKFDDYLFSIIYIVLLGGQFVNA